MNEYTAQDAYRELAEGPVSPGLVVALGLDARTRDTELRQSISAAGGLVSSADIAHRMGMSRTNAMRWTRRLDFPWPVGTVNGYPVWSWSQVQKWLSTQPEGRRRRK